MWLSELAKAVNGTLIGQDVSFDSVGSDSRHIKAGQLFVALQGEHFDGHQYVENALQQGAVAALVSTQQGQHSQVLVADSKRALGQLGAYWRAKLGLPVAAITGSNGKTSVKEMLASILGQYAGNTDNVLATVGNLNNDIGVPLTLLNLKPNHQFAVVEMGMNHAGEIRYLSGLAKPNVALVNNASAAHLGGLGSVEAIAHAKGEIFEGLQAGGTAIINVDDAYANYWKQVAKVFKQMTFGLNTQADVTATYQLGADGSQMQLITPIGTCDLLLPVAGLHNVRNALAASALAVALGVTLEAISEGLRQFAGVKGRLQHKCGINGATIIDDTYNANPASMKAAIDVLAAKYGNKILVLGDMGELGETALALHAEIGEYAKLKGMDALYTMGEMSVEMGRKFSGVAQHFQSPTELANAIKNQLNATSYVLVKGSRFMKMEQVVELLLEKQGQHHNEEKRTCY